MLAVVSLAGWAVAAAAEPGGDPQTLCATDIPEDAPRFEQFPAGAPYTGPVAAPDVAGDPRSRRFRTAIAEGARRGPDFAGRYTVVSWGCGSGCSAIAIVDAVTGRVFHPVRWASSTTSTWRNEEFARPYGELVGFRLDSRLLVVVGGINEDPALRGISYFVWEHERLRRIRFVHKPYE